MNSILLIEDNANNQVVIEDLFEFEEIDAELEIAETAEDGLARVNDINPILILMDLGLPGMSGVEATEQLKSNPATAGIPIWALTAHALKQAQSTAIAAGCTKYVTKPIDTTALAEDLRQFVNSVPSRDAA